jgi:hypothetical protein
VNETEPVRFTGGLTANARIAGHLGWRGHGSVTVRGEGAEFSLGTGFGRIGHRYVERNDLAYVYPVRARRLSLTNVIAAAIPQLSNTGVRFVTRSVGMFNDRDDYLFFSYRHEEWKLIHLLEELKYPVDKKPKTLRFFWGDEAQSYLDKEPDEPAGGIQ